MSNNIKINYPLCEKNCNVKHKLIKHYFTIRSYGTCNLSVCRKKNIRNSIRKEESKLNLN